MASWQPFAAAKGGRMSQQLDAVNHRSQIKSVHRGARYLRVQWADGHKSTFHHIWLRDNCACSECGAHTDGSRFKALLDIPDDISPSAVQSDGSTLTVTWADDGHSSHYGSSWLRANCYSNAERAHRRPKKTLWDASLPNLPTVDYCLARDDVSDRRKLFAAVSEFGFVLVRNVGTEPEEIGRLADIIGYIRDTHFGRIGDLKLRARPSHLADFPTHILPHTDETYRPVPSGIILFQCIRPSDDGAGVSTLVDSHHCVNLLRAQDPDAFTLLSSLPFQHERWADGEMIRSQHSVITLDFEGHVTEVRLNERTMSALSLPEQHMEAAYRAVRRAFRIAYDPANRIAYPLNAGEALVFDNLRVLHGRTAFAGARHIRQCNVMRDEFFAKSAFLEEHVRGPTT
jgi:alpha-ketoglutarate-dependent taurine dioxygenase/DUF971 family protein